MNKSIITFMVILILITATVQSAILPITSNGSLGTFSPGSTGTVTFNTDTGSRLVTVNSNDTPVQVWVYDYTSINIPAGITVKAMGSNPLILLATGTAVIDGTIDVSAVSGANGTDGFELIGYGAGGAGGGGGAVAVFANTILIGTTGQILANGGDGGLPGTLSIISVLNPGLGGSGGSAGPSGGAGGMGGSSVAGGGAGFGGNPPYSGGAGYNGYWGAGGGGGGGGAYNGPGGAGGIGPNGTSNPGYAGTAAAAGPCPALIAGGNGGNGGHVGTGSLGGTGGTSLTPSNANPGASNNGGNGSTQHHNSDQAGGGGGGGGSINGGTGGHGGYGSNLGGGGGAGGGADVCCFYVISTSSTCISYVISTCTTNYILVSTLPCNTCTVTYMTPSTTQTISTSLTFFTISSTTSGFSMSTATTISVNRTYIPCFGVATGIIKPGQVVMTSSGMDTTYYGIVPLDAFGVRIVDVRTTLQYLPARNYYATISTHPSWVKDSIGSVFGVALDDNNPPNIYVTAGSMYSATNWGTIGGTGTGGEIYKLDRFTGQASLFTRLPNSGEGLGNISFDRKHHQFFVTNFMDGRIYRLDMSGAILSWYQPFGTGYGTGTPAITSGFCSMTARIWGIQMNDFDQRLYFSRWTCDHGRYNGTAHNQIWSIGINDASGVGYGDFINISTTLEITIPYYVLYATPTFSNPVASISFSLTGKMMLAERTMSSDNGTFAHEARALEYTGNHCNGWSSSSNNFYIGNSYPNAGGFLNTNGAGGTDYDQFGDVWFTGDALRLGDTYSPASEALFGLQKSPGTGNNNTGFYPNYNANHVAMTSIYIDHDYNVTNQFFSLIGDVQVYKICSTIFSCSISSSTLVSRGSTCFCYSASSVAYSFYSQQTCPPGADGGKGGWGGKAYISSVLYAFPDGLIGGAGGYGAPGGGGVINLGASSDSIVNNGRLSAKGGVDYSIGYVFGFNGIIAIYDGTSTDAYPTPNGITNYLPGANAADWLILGGGGGGGGGAQGRSQAATEVNSWNRYSQNWQTLGK